MTEKLSLVICQLSFINEIINGYGFCSAVALSFLQKSTIITRQSSFWAGNRLMNYDPLFLIDDCRIAIVDC